MYYYGQITILCILYVFSIVIFIVLSQTILWTARGGNDKVKKRTAAIFLMMVVSLTFLIPPTVYAKKFESEKFVFVVDLSGSMVEVNQRYNIFQALELAVGLAPDSSEIALIGVNSDIVVETEFFDPSVLSQRRIFEQTVENLPYAGNTNLVLGIKRATELLNGPGRIILLGDIAEGGMVPAADTAQWEQQAQQLAEQCASDHVAVDLILFNTAPEESRLAPKIEEVAVKSKGDIYRPDTADSLLESIERIFFSHYPYFRLTLKEELEAGKEEAVAIPLALTDAKRVRIYLRGYEPQEDVFASYAQAPLVIGGNEGYSLLELEYPSKSGLRLIFSPAEVERYAQIHMIFSYDLHMIGSTESVIEQDENGNSFQVAKILLQIRESQGETVAADMLEQISPQLVLRTPSGQRETVQPELQADGAYRIQYLPQEFGLYTVEGRLLYDGQEISLPECVLQIEQLEISRNYTVLWIILTVLAARLILLLAALYFYKRRLAQASKPVHGESAFAFSGRLDFYVVKLSQEDYEIAPFTFYLTTIIKREVSLQEVFDRCSVRHTFTGADKISFTAGPDKTLLVKNSGPAELLLRSAVVQKDQNSRISFGEKLYFTAADGVSEIAIYYRNARKA